MPTRCAPVWAQEPLICCCHISGSSGRENAATKVFLMMFSHTQWDCCSQGSFWGTEVLAAAVLLQRWGRCFEHTNMSRVCLTAQSKVRAHKNTPAVLHLPNPASEEWDLQRFIYQVSGGAVEQVGGEDWALLAMPVTWWQFPAFARGIYQHKNEQLSCFLFLLQGCLAEFSILPALWQS